MEPNVHSARLILVLCALGVTTVLGIQLVAATAWQADAANAGPTVVILQLSNDADTDWATKDLMGRLSSFITDDPFFADRLTLIKTADPSVAESLGASIVIYMSHGGPQGIVTGNHLTSWKTMADIVSSSSAVMHLFAACESRRLVQYGSGDSAKKVYTVPGVRAAEVTNVEIASAVMLALGLNPKAVDDYRTTELTRARDLVQSGESVHIMDFQQVILNQVDYIDTHYSDTYTEDYMVLRSSSLVQFCGLNGYLALPFDLQSCIDSYFGVYYQSYDETYLRTLLACSVNYTRNYYQNATWIADTGPMSSPAHGSDNYSEYYVMAAPGGHWEYGPLVFCGGIYKGVVVFSGYASRYTQIWVNVTSSGITLDSVDSISLIQNDTGGIYISKQKVNGTWAEPITGRNPSTSGGLWTDSATICDYEYDPSWPAFTGTQAAGSIMSTGSYLTITGIPTGTAWHGPSFVRTLPSYFELRDFGSLSANLSLVHNGDASRMSITIAALYDSNKKLAIALYANDSSSGTAATTFTAAYYNEDGSKVHFQSSLLAGDVPRVVQMRYDPCRGFFADVPGQEEHWLGGVFYGTGTRLLKYIAIQSYRYGSYSEHDERIYDVRLSYAYSDYTVFHDVCNDMHEFNKDLTFGYGTSANGTLAVPSGQSYMKLTSVVTGSGWHGPDYVHVLDRPFRLYQLSEFSVIGSLVQSSSTMGEMFVGLFDDLKHCVLLVQWGDAWVGSQKGWFNTYFYLQSGASYSQGSGYIYTSFTKTGKLWWDPGLGGNGAMVSSIDGQVLPIALCDNCSRVIKYVAIYGARSESFNLVEMRIQDVNMVAGLTRHDPTAPDPGENNGTGTPTNNDRTAGDADLTQASTSVTLYWTGWWPLLHVVVVHEIHHPQTTLTIQSHIAKDLLGVTEYSACSVTGNAGVLGPASEDDEWMDTHLQTIVSSALVASISVAAGALEYALRMPPPASLFITLASAALSFLAILAVTLPSVFALYMVNKGEWTRNDAGRFLYEIAWGWFWAGLGGIASWGVGQGASAGLLGAVASVMAQLSWLAKILQFMLIAGITIMLVGLALFVVAEAWFRG